MCKKIVVLLFVLLLCSCGKNSAEEINPSSSFDEIKENYEYAHLLATQYEEYAFGVSPNDGSPVFFTMGVLKNLGLGEQYSKNDVFTMDYEDVKKVSSLFLDESLILTETELNCCYGSVGPTYEHIFLEPFNIQKEPNCVSITYGRFIRDNKNNLHWLYPVNYKFKECEITESDIPKFLKDKISSEQIEEMKYKLLDVSNIFNYKTAKQIYKENGYEDLFEEKTYELKTPQDIIKMSQRVNTGLFSEINATYNLCNDIDLKDIEFEPIGKNILLISAYDKRNPNHLGYNGIFNGNGHAIENLKINAKPNAQYDGSTGTGFFGLLDTNAIIQNLNIINADISYNLQNYVPGIGILAGIIKGSTIENCSVSGKIIGVSKIGGLVGFSTFESNYGKNTKKRSNIKNCNTNADIISDSYCGTFIGINHGTTIENCFSKGSVTVKKFSESEETAMGVGGFGGQNVFADILNSKCETYINTNINGKCIGSFVGLNKGNIRNCSYLKDISFWEPSGDTPDNFITDIRALSKNEFYNLSEASDISFSSQIREVSQPQIVKTETRNFWEIRSDILENAKRFKGQNPDTCGWLYVYDTTLDSPVFKVKDNDFYLKHNDYKEPDKNGALVSDYNNSFSGRDTQSRNLVIYGHSKDENPDGGVEASREFEHFTELKRYQNIDFCNKNPYFMFSDLNESMVFEVFAAFHTKTSFAYNTANPSDKQFSAIISEAKKKSLFNFNVPVDTNDKIMTLSTCCRRIVPTYPNGYRFVIMGKLVPKGEILTYDRNVTVNETALTPQNIYE